MRTYTDAGKLPVADAVAKLPNNSGKGYILKASTEGASKKPDSLLVTPTLFPAGHPLSSMDLSTLGFEMRKTIVNKGGNNALAGMVTKRAKNGSRGIRTPDPMIKSHLL